MKSISAYILNSLILLMLFLMPLGAQNKAQKKEKTAPEVTYPMLNGIQVGIDLFGPGSYLIGGSVLSTEVQASVDLWHRFLPTVALGYSTSDHWDEEGILSKHSGLYGKIGMDYNFLWKKAHGNMMLLGLRYGISSESYSVGADALKDPIWASDSGQQSGSWRYDDMKAMTGWLEVVLGIRAHVTGPIHMGWSLAFRKRLHGTTGKYGNPVHVPGFGKYGKDGIGFSYHIIYQF